MVLTIGNQQFSIKSFNFVVFNKKYMSLKGTVLANDEKSHSML